MGNPKSISQKIVPDRKKVPVVVFEIGKGAHTKLFQCGNNLICWQNRQMFYLKSVSHLSGISNIHIVYVDNDIILHMYTVEVACRVIPADGISPPSSNSKGGLIGGRIESNASPRRSNCVGDFHLYPCMSLWGRNSDKFSRCGPE